MVLSVGVRSGPLATVVNGGSSSGDPGREGVLTCGCFAPVVTVRASRDQQFPMLCGPSTDRVATR
jgi:hypothetical protein